MTAIAREKWKRMSLDERINARGLAATMGIDAAIDEVWFAREERWSGPPERMPDLPPGTTIALG